jgi:hypothetical protein
MTTKHKHHDKQHERVDMDKHNVHFDSKTYRWEDYEGSLSTMPARYWSRVSTKHCKKDLEEVPFVPEEKRNRKKHDWEDALRPLDDRKRSDHQLIRKLEHLVEHAELNAEKKEKERQAQLLKAALAVEDARHGQPEESASESASAPDDDKKPRQKQSGREADEINRDKHGVRLFSNDGKHFFNIGVYKSRKEPGSSTVCLFVAGRPYVYTLDKSKMEALYKEVTRTFSRKDLRRLIEHSRPT